MSESAWFICEWKIFHILLLYYHLVMVIGTWKLTGYCIIIVLRVVCRYVHFFFFLPPLRFILSLSFYCHPQTNMTNAPYFNLFSSKPLCRFVQKWQYYCGKINMQNVLQIAVKIHFKIVGICKLYNKIL